MDITEVIYAGDLVYSYCFASGLFLPILVFNKISGLIGIYMMTLLLEVDPVKNLELTTAITIIDKIPASKLSGIDVGIHHIFGVGLFLVCAILPYIYWGRMFIFTYYKEMSSYTNKKNFIVILLWTICGVILLNALSLGTSNFSKNFTTFSIANEMLEKSELELKKESPNWNYLLYASNFISSLESIPVAKRYEEGIKSILYKMIILKQEKIVPMLRVAYEEKDFERFEGIVETVLQSTAKSKEFPENYRDIMEDLFYLENQLKNIRMLKQKDGFSYYDRKVAIYWHYSSNESKIQIKILP